jgi:hypothetical protein
MCEDADLEVVSQLEEQASRFRAGQHLQPSLLGAHPVIASARKSSGSPVSRFHSIR